MQDKQDAGYEELRNIFMVQFNQRRLQWLPCSNETNRNVYVSRIYSRNRNRLLGLLQIGPNGIKGESVTRDRIIFCVLTEKIKLVYNNETSLLKTPDHFVIEANKKYSLENPCSNAIAYLVFELKLPQPQPQPQAQPQPKPGDTISYKQSMMRAWKKRQ